MKESNPAVNSEHLEYHFKRIIFLVIVVSLIKNRAIVWAILNGDISNWPILAIETILLIIGALLGEYLWGRWFREKIMSIVNQYS